MKIRHLVAVGLIGAVTFVGTAGVAAAQTTPNSSTPAAQNRQTLCAKATARLPKLNDRIQKVEQRITTLQQRLANAQAKSQANRVALLEPRITWAQTVHEHLVSVVSQINQRCGTA